MWRARGGRRLRQIKTYDVIIAGNGLVGATLGGVLGRGALRVALVAPAAAGDWPGEAVEERVSAVNRASESLLRNLGAWEDIAQRRAQKFNAVCACHESGGGKVQFHAADIGETHLGHIVENNLIVRAVVENTAGVDNVIGTISDVRQDEDGVSVVTDNGELRAKVLAACDGPDSTVRQAVGAAVDGGEYAQRCVVGNVFFDGDHRQMAWQRFLHGGPVGVLPLAGRACSIAWTCAAERAVALCGMGEEEFIAELSSAVDGHLGNITGVGRRLSFPLRHLHAKNYVHGRVVLVGDAAHVVHPLAGLGANLGMMDAAALGAVLCEAGAKARDPGAAFFLRRYERRRRAENAAVLTVLHGFNAVFSREHRAGGLVDGAMEIANRFQPAKNLLMQLASGLGGDVPAMARPQAA